MTISPDITAQVELFTTEQGGRTGPTMAKHFGCPMKLGEGYYDCRLLLAETGPLFPGEKRTVGIKFLDTDSVKLKLAMGVEFELWEGRKIGRGKIVGVANL